MQVSWENEKTFGKRGKTRSAFCFKIKKLISYKTIYVSVSGKYSIICPWLYSLKPDWTRLVATKTEIVPV